MAQILAVFAELQRRLIGQRTKDAVAVRRRQGVRLGRPPQLQRKVVKQIIDARNSGEGWSSIACDSTHEAFPLRKAEPGGTQRQSEPCFCQTPGPDSSGTE